MTPGIPSDRHIAATRRRLVHLDGLKGKSTAAERAILNAGMARRGIVQHELEGLRNRSLIDEVAGTRYNELMSERGQLDLVIARAKQALGRP